MELLGRVRGHVDTLRLGGCFPGVAYIQRFYDALSTFTNLKRVVFGAHISISISSNPSCLPIWRSIGIRLVCIRINLLEHVLDQHWNAITVRIITYCPALQRLFLGPNFPCAGMNNHYQTLLGVYNIYNTQLVRAPYGRMDLADLPYFLHMCPEIRLIWPHGFGILHPSVFKILYFIVLKT